MLDERFLDDFYGFTRYTDDLDLMLHLEDKNIGRFIKAIKPLGFKPRIPAPLEELASAEKRRQWIKKKGALVLNLYNPKNPYEQIDVFLQTPIEFKEAYPQRRTLTVQGIKISSISLNHLITLKEKAGRPIDAADLAILRRLRYRHGKE